MVDVLRWDEFQTKKFYDFAIVDNRFKKYLPDLIDPDSE